MNTVYATPARIGNPNAAHMYVVEVEHTATNTRGQGFPSIDVLANNRTQAGSIARQHGYAVRSVNMVG